MTDERQGEALWSALRRLPPGSGVVFRHHATPARDRRALLRRVRRIAMARRLVLTVAGTTHNGRRPVTAAAHDRRQAIEATRRGARYLFVSPVFATRSHPGAPGTGPAGAVRIARRLGPRIVALGGMDAKRWRRIRTMGFDGWAAIDALTPRVRGRANPG